MVARVRSAAEAASFERLGAGLIGVTLDPDARFDDARTVTVGEAVEIGTALGSARLVLAANLGDDLERTRAAVARTGARLVQPVNGLLPPDPVRSALREAGVGIVYGGVEISHDDDPSWVFSRYAEVDDLTPPSDRPATASVFTPTPTRCGH